MYRRALMFMMFVSALTAGSGVCSDTTYTIRLCNGNTLTANSYTLEDGKVHLAYPMGEAVIRASEVASITTGDGTVNLLQSQGVAQPKPKEEPARQAAVPPTQVTVAATVASAGGNAAIGGPAPNGAAGGAPALKKAGLAGSKKHGGPAAVGHSGSHVRSGPPVDDPDADDLYAQSDKINASDDMTEAEEAAFNKEFDDAINKN